MTLTVERCVHIFKFDSSGGLKHSLSTFIEWFYAISMFRYDYVYILLLMPMLNLLI